jgi:hypothetical protein
MTAQYVIAQVKEIERDTIRRRRWQVIPTEKALERECHGRLAQRFLDSRR